MAIPHYDIIAVSRVPASGAAPTLTELGSIAVQEKFSYSEELVGDGFIALSVDVRNTLDSIVDRFRDLIVNPTEIRIYRDGTLMKQAVIIGVQQQGSTVTLQARGLLYYLRFMFVTADLDYQDIDQYVIAKGLIDQWQAQTFGDLGFDTSGMGTSGELRRRTYPRDELVNIGHSIEILASNVTGFDYFIDASRNFVVTAARGSDLSATVFLDSRGIMSPDIFLSGTAGRIGSMAIAIGGGVDNEPPVYSTNTDATSLATLGRLAGAVVFDGVKLQGTLDDHTQAMVDVLSVQAVEPGGKTLFPVAGVGVGDFNVGDKVTWNYDSELGSFTLTPDVWKRIVNVSNTGQEEITVEFV